MKIIPEAFVKSLMISLVIFYQSILWANPIEKSDKFRILNITHKMKVQIVSNTADDKTEFTVYNQSDNSLAVQTYPPRSVNRKLLMKDSDLWLFTPGIKKAIRVGLDQRLSGEVANGDILRTKFSNDYEFEFAKENEKSQVVYNLTKKTDNATYSKIVYTLNKNDFRPIQADFYAASGKILKTATYQDYKKLSGQTVFTKVTVKDAITNNISTITYSNHAKAKLDSTFFNKESMVD